MISMSPFFSIIIPVYNVAPYLRECLDSVLSQTFTDWEAICVDDGSTDESGSILDEYAVKDARIKVVHQQNAGVSAARNRALDVARGRWVGFIDADDCVSNKWVSVWDYCVRMSSNIEIVKLGGKIWKTGSKPFASEEWDVDIYDTSHSVVEYVQACIFGYTAWKYVVRRSLLDNSRFIEGIRINEDVLFISNCLFRATVLCVCAYDGYFYRWRTGSALRIGVRDEDMVAFLVGVERIISRWKGDIVDSLKSYKCWLARRILSDVLGCFVAKGIRPVRSISKSHDLVKNGVISLKQLRIRQWIQWRLIMSGGVVGFIMLYVYYRAITCFRFAIK